MSVDYLFDLKTLLIILERTGTDLTSEFNFLNSLDEVDYTRETLARTTYIREALTLVVRSFDAAKTRYVLTTNSLN